MKNKNDANKNKTTKTGSEPRLTKPDLWARIRDHHRLLLADEGYRSRLGAEGGIPRGDQDALILEYLRFAYLALASPDGATPSRAVDEAWHTHILFTRSYASFCERATGAFLHHRPGSGAADEAGFREAYHRTLDRYAAEFGEAPARWWPDDRPGPVPLPAPLPPQPAEPGRASLAAARLCEAFLVLAIPLAMLGAMSAFVLRAEPWVTWLSLGAGFAIGLPFALMALSGNGLAKEGSGGSSGSGSGGSCGGIACASSCGGGGCGGGGCGC